MATKQDDESNKRKPAFKADLDIKIIKALSLTKAPTGYSAEGKLEFAPNPPKDKDGNALGPALTSYTIWDSNQAAPPTRRQSQRQDQLYKSLSFIRITQRTILKTPAVKPQNARITRFYAAVNTKHHRALAARRRRSRLRSGRVEGREGDKPKVLISQG